jgi:hypothetical protein
MELVSRWLAGCALAFAVALVVVPAAGATPQAFSNDDTPASVRVRAYDLAYNLDYDEAIALMRSALERWPRDPTLHRSLGTMVWLKILFTRGSVTIDDYLGPLSKQYVSFKPPPASLVAEFVDDVDRAAALAQERLARQPNDLDALYEYGAAVGLRASYTATVEGRMLAAVRATLQAYKAHERVLRADPRRAEAGLLVGTYQYIIANLSWPLRWMALVVGFSASRERGLQLLERASQPRATPRSRRASACSSSTAASGGTTRRTPSYATWRAGSPAIACCGGTRQPPPSREAESGTPSGTWTRASRASRPMRGPEWPGRRRCGTSSGGPCALRPAAGATRPGQIWRRPCGLRVATGSRVGRA